MRHGSISEAARAIKRSQPAITAMIQTLESELNFVLFKRHKGKLIPTPEAEFLLEESIAILNRVEQAQTVLSGISNQSAGRLRIACHPAASSFFIPDLLSHFLTDKPGINVTLKAQPSNTIEDLVASHQYDIGFTESPHRRNSTQQDEFELECFCAVSVDSELARIDCVTPHHLDNKPMAILFSEHPTAQQTIAAFQKDDVRLNRRFELQTFMTGLQLVKAQLCYMLCDTVTAYSYLKLSGKNSGVIFRRFDPSIKNTVSIITASNKPISLAAQKFCLVLKNKIEEMKNTVFEQSI
jgi:DNA-binding transcriptional LysR family regulator